MKKGKVYLVGAGPGDIGLLTVKGLRCLQSAEVVVYDYHLNAQVLNYVRHSAEFIYAGKRGGHHAMTQDEINLALVEKAKEGKIVCRLKGGDPFVFGRGGEEAGVLASQGIDFEVVPGVSSVIAAPAYAGIPLTHRGYSSSFAVITGNEATDKTTSSISWPELAQTRDTLVFLMGVKNIGPITERLVDAGRTADTPVAVIRWGARPDQETVIGTLDTIAQMVKERHLRPPAVMVVGSVVNLRNTLKWYEKKPLFGHRILVTGEYSAHYEPLKDLGGEIFEFPTVRTEPPADYADLDAAIERITGYEWLILRDSTIFRFFMERYFQSGRDIRDLKGIRLCAVGAPCADAIRGSGMLPELVADENAPHRLLQTLADLSKTKGVQGMRILVPRDEAEEDVFADIDRDAVDTLDTPAVCRTVKREKHGKRLKRFLFEGRISVATFASAAAFTNFVDMVGEDALPFLQKVTIAAIGPVTRSTIETAGLTVTITPMQATVDAMVEKIVRWAAERKA
jgi:uroporphyrinogen III methyltransferase/synthase